MRVLVFSQASWNTVNSFGNTLTNWFDGWEEAQFFHFYARQQKPNTKIVDTYYHVSAIEILKGSLLGRQTGTMFNASELIFEDSNEKTEKEQSQIAKLHRNKKEIVYWGMEKVWLSKKWINSSFDRFVGVANPDVIFAFATNSYILEPAIQHIKQSYPDVKVILYIADDPQAEYENHAWYRRGYLKKGIDYCFDVADKLYGASDEMCEKYRSIYGKEVTPLYKGCTFEKPVKKENNDILRLVYAGNLLYGRKETLIEIAKSLAKINELGVKAVLEVYSNTPIDEDEKRQWFDNINAYYMGVRPYDEIKTILNEADIVLHVESFEEDRMKAVKYSFSTKIIDCLQSGSVVVGIGPSGIASIEYIRKVDGAITIDNNSDIYRELSNLIEQKDTFLSRANATREYAIQHHDVNAVRKKLHNDFISVMNKPSRE